MAVFNGAFPVLPGKVDTARAFAKETMGPRRSGYDQSQKRGGITRETRSVQETPDGNAFVLVWFESPDPEKSFAEVARFLGLRRVVPRTGQGGQRRGPHRASGGRPRAHPGLERLSS